MRHSEENDYSKSGEEMIIFMRTFVHFLDNKSDYDDNMHLVHRAGKIASSIYTDAPEP